MGKVRYGSQLKVRGNAQADPLCPAQAGDKKACLVVMMQAGDPVAVCWVRV